MYNKPATRHELCRALGIFAVLLKDAPPHPDDAAQAEQTATLIEEYCHDGDEAPETHPDQNLIVLHCMARTIAEHIKRHGICRPSDILNSGYSTAEVNRHWSMAFALAGVRLTETT